MHHLKQLISTYDCHLFGFKMFNEKWSFLKNFLLRAGYKYLLQIEVFVIFALTTLLFSPLCVSLQVKYFRWYSNRHLRSGGTKRWKQEGGIFENGRKGQKNVLKCVFSENRRKFEDDFLPKSEKAVTKFSKVGGGILPGRAAPEHQWNHLENFWNLF